MAITYFADTLPKKTTRAHYHQKGYVSLFSYLQRQDHLPNNLHHDILNLAQPPYDETYNILAFRTQVRRARLDAEGLKSFFSAKSKTACALFVRKCKELRFV